MQPPPAADTVSVLPIENATKNVAPTCCSLLHEAAAGHWAKLCHCSLHRSISGPPVQVADVHDGVVDMRRSRRLCRQDAQQDTVIEKQLARWCW